MTPIFTIVLLLILLCAVVVAVTRMRSKNLKPDDRKTKDVISYNRKNTLIKSYQEEIDISDARFWANK